MPFRPVRHNGLRPEVINTNNCSAQQHIRHKRFTPRGTLQEQTRFKQQISQVSTWLASEK
jgi:hypothetical protein